MAHITDVIKYEGDNSTFIWKHPRENFNDLTQLIVHESQEAILFMNGQALDLFGPGRHTLKTQNIPKIGGMLKHNTGLKNPFHCEIYFINQTVQMGLKWGTDSKIRYIDPESGVPIELGASGEMNLQVCDSRKLLVKLVGTMKGIAWDAESKDFTKSIQNSFRPMISTEIKANLASVIKAQSVNILEIDEHLVEIGNELHKKILPGFEDFGLTVPQFYLNTVVLPEEDPNFKKIRELYTISLQKRMIDAEKDIRTSKAQADAEIAAAQRAIEIEKQTTQTEIARHEAERRVIESEAQAEAIRRTGYAEAQVMQAQGVTKKDYIQADVQKAFAEGIGNMGGSGGSAAGDVMGIGIGLQAAGAMSDRFGNLFSSLGSQQASIQCAKCGVEIPQGSKFCLQCGEKVVVASSDGIVCPDCGKTVKKGNFCPECGHKFVKVCPTCAKENPEGAKFCLECGTKL